MLEMQEKMNQEGKQEKLPIAIVVSHWKFFLKLREHRKWRFQSATTKNNVFISFLAIHPLLWIGIKCR